MKKDERKAIFFSFYDQLLPEHAEKAKANYDPLFEEGKEPTDHADAINYGFEWLDDANWHSIHADICNGSYPLQLTPQVCTAKAKEVMYADPLPTDAAERKTYPIFSGFITYFPHAIAKVAHLSYKGNLQHHPDKPLHWDMDKSSDELDALMRHMIDGDWEQVAWRALANLERKLTGKCTYDNQD